MIKKYSNLLVGSCLILLFIIWTLLVCFVDVQAIGPLGSKVGLASFNDYFFYLIGENNTLYQITDLLTYVSIAIAFVFVVLFAYQLIKRKSFKKVDKKLYALFLGYAVIVIVFILFEILKINYRPVLIESELEASYPSTHMLISIFILLSAIYMNHHYFKNNKTIKIVIDVILILLLVTNCIGRILSGVHWMSDIIGGALISLGVYFIYVYFSNYLENKE